MSKSKSVEKPVTPNAKSSNNSNGNNTNNNIEKNLFFYQLGRWTREEHNRFVDALTLYGKNWKKVEEHVGSRSGA